MTTKEKNSTNIKKSKVDENYEMLIGFGFDKQKAIKWARRLDTIPRLIMIIMLAFCIGVVVGRIGYVHKSELNQEKTSYAQTVEEPNKANAKHEMMANKRNDRPKQSETETSADLSENESEESESEISGKLSENESEESEEEILVDSSLDEPEEPEEQEGEAFTEDEGLFEDNTFGLFQGAMAYTEDDFDMFCCVAFAEAGLAESYECQLGTMWEIRNGICKRTDGDFYAEIYHENRYSSMNSGVPFCDGQVITPDIIPDSYKELARKVLNSEIPDPTNGSTSFYAYLEDCDSGEEFAEKYSLTQYTVLGRHIFFLEEEWPFG